MAFRIAVLIALAAGARAADRVPMPYETARAIIETAPAPPVLRTGATEWLEWSRQHDRSVRARLVQGELDSMVNLLLFGTSFTVRPRIAIEALGEASRGGLLRGRLDDFLAALRAPGENERMLFLRTMLAEQGHDPDRAETGVYILQQLERVLKEINVFAERNRGDGATPVFFDRGVSLDATILPNFGVEETLKDLLRRGLLSERGVQRIGVIGPGVDFIDKESGYDYYPQQTIQPFAMYDSARRLGLAREAPLRVTVFDISARVLDHVRHAREGAEAGREYVIQLPRPAGERWSEQARSYWQAFGDHAGDTVEPIAPPPASGNPDTRAVRVTREALLACDAQDLNIVTEQLDLSASERYDLIVATNVLVYYDPFEQALALENIAAMLAPGGLLITNDRLPVRAGSNVDEAGSTSVSYSEGGARDVFYWYRRSR